MSQQIEGNTKTFTTAEALNAFCRVKLDSSADVVYADAGEDWIGTTEEYAASGANVAVRLRSATGTRKMVAAGAVSIGDIVYGADDGEIDDAPTGEAVGRALEAATADGDIIEILTVVGASQAAGDSVEVIGGSGGIVALNLVYVSDQTDNVMTVLKAQGTTGGRFADFICPNAIGAAAKGAALKTFLLSGIDTDAGSVGDPVYLSDSAAGGYVLVKPTATDKVQIVGRIVEDSATTGAILFDLSGPQQVVHDHSDASEGGDLGDHGSGTITLADAKNIVANTTTGSEIGTAAGQKLGFWGATPAVQASHVADPAATAADPDALTATAVGDLGSTNTTPFGYSSEANADAVHTAIDALVADIASIRTQLVAAIDDIQANNTAIDSILGQLASTGLHAAT